MVFYNLINKKKIIKGAWITLILVFIYVVFSMMRLSLVYESNTSEVDFINDFNTDWMFNIEGTDSTSIIDLPKYKLENPELKKYKITKQLPDYYLREPSLILGSSQQHIKVFIDDEEVYEFKSLKDLKGNKTNGAGLVFIDLPKDCIGKTISIEYDTSFKRVSGFISSIFYGEKSENVLFLISESLSKIVLSSALLIISIICIMFAIKLKSFNIREAKGMFALAFTLLLVVIWVVIQSEWVCMFKTNFAVNYYLEFIVSHSLPVFFYYYIYSMCNIKNDFVIKIIYKIHFIILIIFVVMQYFGISDFFSINSIYLYMLLITLLISSSILIGNLRENSFLKKYIVMLFLMIIFTVSQIFIVTYLTINISRNIIVSCLLMIAINLIYNFFNSYFSMYDSKIRNLYLQSQFKRQLNHFNNVNAEYDKLRRYRHDMKNHLLCINHLLVKGDYKHALSYIEDINVHLSKNNDVFDTNNPILDAILTEKKKIALDKGITFEDNIKVSKDMKIEPVDFCIIFANALDNAIESCDKISKKDKEIKIDMFSKNNMLIVKIRNSMEGNLILNNNKILTSKKNKKNHGIGLTNIKKTISKYDGILDICSEDDIFELSFTLYNI